MDDKKKREDELLKCLLTLSRIFKDACKEFDGIVHQEEFYLCRCKFTLFFVYDSITINVNAGCNFKSFLLEFEDDKYGEEERKIARMILSLPGLPPDLLIQKLNQIGVKEL